MTQPEQYPPTSFGSRYRKDSSTSWNSRSTSRSRTSSTHRSHYATPTAPLPPNNNNFLHPYTASSGSRSRTSSSTTLVDPSNDAKNPPSTKKGPFWRLFKAKKEIDPDTSSIETEKTLKRRSRSVGSFDVHPSLYHSRYAPANVYGNGGASRSTNVLSPTSNNGRLPRGCAPGVAARQGAHRESTDIPKDYNHPWFYRNAQDATEAEERCAKEAARQQARNAAKMQTERINALPPDDVEFKRKGPKYFERMFRYELVTPVYDRPWYPEGEKQQV